MTRIRLWFERRRYPTFWLCGNCGEMFQRVHRCPATHEKIRAV